MEGKELFTRKEYFQLFDNLQSKIDTIKKEHAEKVTRLQETITKLQGDLDYERNKSTILNETIVKMTDEVLEITKTM